MENFIVSARKYRPDSFITVVGQDAITQTLKNAIKTNHLAHAYLFCGPRGVGKTTCARIFAKTINCQNLTPEMEACNTCESCLSFNQNRSYNIHELDAASNNSVDDIRLLIEKVRIPPQIGKYSVYIIDEVHMLSSSAFNSFLKTLEEPPPHVIYILATTEKHKIIPTILSRCQIFDFNRIKVEDTVNFLEKIAQKEGVNYEREALNIIAQKADGAMRDALSIFDQVVSFSENKITYNKVIENLNVLDYEYYFSLVNAFLVNDVSAVLLIYNEILEKGFDSHQFINGLSSHFRDILICKDPNTLQLLEVTDNIKAKYQLQSQKCSRMFLYEALDVTNKCDVSYKISNNKRLHIELTLIKLANINSEKKKPEHITEPDTAIQNSSYKPDLKLSTDKLITEKENIDTPQVVKESSSKFSIKNALNQRVPSQPDNKIIQEKNVEKEITEINKFSKEELNEKWKEYAQSIQEDEPRLANTLTNFAPCLKNDCIIEYEVANELQQEVVLKKKNEITNFLQKELKNNRIGLEVKIKQIYEENKLYTQEDKFKFLAAKNNNINTLKQKFKLDFD